MAKPGRGRPATSSGSDSRSSLSRSYTGSDSRSRSPSRSRSLSSSSSLSRSVSSRSRSPPPRRKSPAEGARRGRSPRPQSKKTFPLPRKTSPILKSLVLHIDQLSRNVNEAHLKEIFSNFGEVVNVRLVIDHIVNLSRGYGYVEFKTRADVEKAQAYMDGGQIDGNVVRARFTLPERKKVSPPPKVVGTASKRDTPRVDNIGADVEKDGPKRLRETSPRCKPHSPLRRRSLRRKLDSPPRQRVGSSIRRQGESPYHHVETPPRRRPASPGRSHSPSFLPRRNRSPSRISPRRICGSPVRRRSPIPLRHRRARSPRRRSFSRRRSCSPIRRPVPSRSRSVTPRRGRAPVSRRGRSSSHTGSPSPRRVARRVSRSRSPGRPLRGRSIGNSSSSSSPPRKP